MTACNGHCFEQAGVFMLLRANESLQTGTCLALLLSGVSVGLPPWTTGARRGS